MLLGLALVASLLPLHVLAQPLDEPADFSATQPAGTYAAGWTEFDFDGLDAAHTVRVHYPANVSGEDAPRADPFDLAPLLFWSVESDRPLTDYDWLGIALAEAGYVMVTLPDDWASEDAADLLLDLIELRSHLGAINASGGQLGDPDWLQGMLDLTHWGLGGHGDGAARAALIQAFWHVYQGGNPHHPPRALVGLGLTNEYVGIDWNPTVPIPQPGYGLFMTGSLDEMSPQADDLVPFLAAWPGPWVRYEVLGANHIQYRETDTFLERTFSDGEATLTREGQQAHAVVPILGFLDHMLRGDPQGWYTATAREGPGTSASDPDAYVSLGMSRADVLAMHSPTGPSGPVAHTETMVFTAAVRHRDATQPTEVTVTCRVGANTTAGWWGGIGGHPQHPAGRAGCDVPATDLGPGNHTIQLTAVVDDLPGHASFTIERLNAPPLPRLPTPTPTLPQRGSTVLAIDDVAYDPDGQPLLLIDSNISGPNASQLVLSADPSGLLIEHIGQPEWEGQVPLRLTLQESSGALPALINVSTTIVVTAFDDPVQLLAPLALLQLDEDANATWIDLADHLRDPEGAPLVVTLGPSPALFTATGDGSAVRLELTPDASGNGSLAISVSDGTTAPLNLTLQVVVHPQPDEPRFNAANLTIEFDEDAITLIPLDTLAWDPDGDTINHTLHAGGTDVIATLWHGNLRLEPAADWTGTDTAWRLGISDGGRVITESLTLTVRPINDPPEVVWQELPEPGKDGLVVRWTHVDVDGPQGWQLVSSFNGVPERLTDASCAESSAVQACSATLAVNDLELVDNRLELWVTDGEDRSNGFTRWVTVEQAPSDGQDGDGGLGGVSENQRALLPWLVATVVALAAAAGGVWLLMGGSDEDEDDLG